MNRHGSIDTQAERLIEGYRQLDEVTQDKLMAGIIGMAYIAKLDEVERIDERRVTDERPTAY